MWAQLVAALAFILYGTVLELNYYGVVPSYCTTHPGLKALQAIIFVNLFAFLAVAYLAGLLIAKAAAGRRAAERHQRRAGRVCRPCTKTSFTPSAAD